MGLSSKKDYCLKWKINCVSFEIEKRALQKSEERLKSPRERSPFTNPAQTNVSKCIIITYRSGRAFYSHD